MMKKSTEKLQQDEMNILTELHNNAKQGIETIAKRCGLYGQKVRRIIKQLEERHIIWGYTAVTDAEKMNQQRFILCIKRTNKPLDKKIFDKIDTMDLEDLAHPLGLQVVSSYYVHGTYDWIIIFTGQDIQQAKKFCGVLHTEFPGAVEQIDIQQILYSVRAQYIYNPDRRRLHELIE